MDAVDARVMEEARTGVRRQRARAGVDRQRHARRAEQHMPVGVDELLVAAHLVGLRRQVAKRAGLRARRRLRGAGWPETWRLIRSSSVPEARRAGVGSNEAQAVGAGAQLGVHLAAQLV